MIIETERRSEEFDVKQLHEVLERRSSLETLGENNVPVGGMVKLQAPEFDSVEFSSQRRLKRVEVVELDVMVLVVEFIPEIPEEVNENVSWTRALVSRALYRSVKFEKEYYKKKKREYVHAFFHRIQQISLFQ